jgi:hypothetical protein
MLDSELSLWDIEGIISEIEYDSDVSSSNNNDDDTFLVPDFGGPSLQYEAANSAKLFFPYVELDLSERNSGRIEPYEAPVDPDFIQALQDATAGIWSEGEGDDRVGWECFFGNSDSEQETKRPKRRKRRREPEELPKINIVCKDSSEDEEEESSGETTDEEEFVRLWKIKAWEHKIKSPKLKPQQSARVLRQSPPRERVVTTTSHQPPPLGTWAKDASSELLVLDGISVRSATRAARQGRRNSGTKRHSQSKDRGVRRRSPRSKVNNEDEDEDEEEGDEDEDEDGILSPRVEVDILEVDDILDASLLLSSADSDGSDIKTRRKRRKRKSQSPNQASTAAAAAATTATRRPSEVIAPGPPTRKRVPVGLFRQGITMGEKVHGRDIRAAIKEWYALQTRRQRQQRR